MVKDLLEMLKYHSNIPSRDLQVYANIFPRRLNIEISEHRRRSFHKGYYVSAILSLRSIFTISSKAACLNS
ncbi:MAG: hypothetical protein KC713_08595, partial [Candidatus Omnitrophica bacterium]|nr:hypothetical protein [Candidatus Omnitrophota bacterium]